MNTVTSVVLPSLRRQQLHHLEDNGTVSLAFEVDAGTFYLHICEITSPPILWLRYFPQLSIGSEDVALMLAVLVANRSSWALKVGCDPADGELVVDVEIPLLHGRLTEESFTTYLTDSTNAVAELVAELMRVQREDLSADQMANLFAHSRQRLA